MRIAITGASGFVGVNVQKYLKVSYAIKKMSIRYICNQKLEIDTDAVIHLAGKAHDLKKVSNPKEYYESNFELTKQLFDAFLESKAEVFVFMSTVKAVADTVNDTLTESVVPNPKTHYGIAKHLAEEYVLSKELPIGKRVYILRPCMIHGPSNKGNLNLLYKLVAKGFPWPLGAFNNQRSFLSIENLCFVIKEIIENKKIPSGIYNVSDDNTLSTNELITLISCSLNKKNNIWSIPSFYIRGLARVGDCLQLPLNSDRLQKLTNNYIVSNERIVKAIGKSLPVSIKKGLMDTLNSFKY